MSTIFTNCECGQKPYYTFKGIKAANLEETLNGVGPFTILAPVNMAFGNLVAPDTF
jgi:uncharacterized surface protein with fasciclin (FAS1) repeats